MAVSASFHRNVFLLNQLVPPSDDFKKVFREVRILLFFILWSFILKYIFLSHILTLLVFIDNK